MKSSQTPTSLVALYFEKNGENASKMEWKSVNLRIYEEGIILESFRIVKFVKLKSIMLVSVSDFEAGM